MMNKANPALIGGFVVGAAALVVVGVLMFSSGQLLQEKLTYVLYFGSSVEGLQRGAPVNFRGVKVGTVSNLVVEFDINNAEHSARTPVYIQLAVDGMREVGGQMTSKLTAPAVMELLVKRGLRASLKSQSFVTGLLAVEFDFYPDTPVKLTGFSEDIPELPTIQSGFEAITETATQTAKRIGDLPFEDLFAQFQSIVQGFQRILQGVESVNLGESLHTAATAAGQSGVELQQLLQMLNRETPSLAANLRATSTSAQRLMERDLAPALQALTGALRDSQTLAQQLNSRLGSLSASLEDASQAAQQTLGSVEEAISEDSSLRADVAKALDELASAARSIRILAEALERRPETLIYGKGRVKSR